MNDTIPQRQSHLPLSINQKRLWIVSQQDEQNPAYNLSLTYHFKSEINYDVFNKSMSILFNRQQTMFSIFKQKDGIPYIEIYPRVVKVEFIDFSDFPVETRREKIFSFAGEDLRKCFDLEKGPLYRIYLLKEDNNNYFFHATFHHLIFDGSSKPIFVKEFSRIYTDLINGKDISLKKLAFQSFDFAELEGALLTDDDKKELVEFWKENLKECNPELKIPYDNARKEFPSGLGCKETFIISENNTKRLKALSTEASSSLFKTMLSVLGVFLQKYTGENDICIGIPISHRHLNPALEDTFGFFVSTSVVRINQEPNSNFREFIKYASNITNKAIKNSRLSFDKIVEAVNPVRTNFNPLYQVSLTWWSNFLIPFNLNGVIGESVSIPLGVSSDDISFYMWEDENIIKGKIEYNVDVFNINTIIRLKDNFLHLIENLCTYPDKNLNLISLITESELSQISEINNTRTDYPKNKTIVQLFEEQVNLYPEKTAVVFKDNSLTYKQLNDRTNQLARVLRNAGVNANTPVGIMIDKSVDMIVGIFGILKAGGGYVPIDSRYPEQRIDFVIKDSGCKILLTHEKCNKLSIEGLNELYLDSEHSYNIDKSNIEGINTPSDLAYIIYTSGTTGIPKGTLIPQQGVVRLVRNTNYIDFTSEDRVLQASAIVFDASTEEIFGALLNGGTLYIVEKQTILDPNALGEVLLNNNITIVDLASALFTQIAEIRTDIFSKVEKLILGGDVLSAPHVNKVRKNNPQLTVINTYGPTENSCNSTAYVIDRDFDYNIPIGKPISNSTAYIFDKSMNYQPFGVIGELYVGGDGLSTGYLNRDDLNRVSFTYNPYNPGERIYKTGDFARWLPDGNIEFHGRIDNQIKIRGFRVELEEIESVISNIDGIIETLIKPVKVGEGDYKLIAFLNVSETFNLDTKAIGLIIKSKLPPYMVPSVYKIMHGFKKTVNGKIDREALRFEISELQENERIENGVLSPTEKVLLAIWCDVLKTNDISTTDNFFDIGGNSLLIISLSSKIENTFKIKFNIRNFFSTPRIRDLAELIDMKINSNILVTKQNDSTIKMTGGEI